MVFLKDEKIDHISRFYSSTQTQPDLITYKKPFINILFTFVLDKKPTFDKIKIDKRIRTERENSSLESLSSTIRALNSLILFSKIGKDE